MTLTDRNIFDRLCIFMRETQLLQSTFSLLGWDERTGMPPEGAEYRGEQMTYLAGIIHRRRTDSKLGDWLERLIDSPLSSKPHSIEGTIIRESKRQFDRQRKLPESLVMELTRTSVQGQQDWQKAREKNEFSIFMPSLEKIIHLKRQEADAIGFLECRYDALLDEYEPWETTARVKNILEGLCRELTPLLQQIAGASPVSQSHCLNRTFPIEKQKNLGGKSQKISVLISSRGDSIQRCILFALNLGHTIRGLQRGMTNSFCQLRCLAFCMRLGTQFTSKDYKNSGMVCLLGKLFL